MKLGLISDSHDHLDNIRKAARLFRERGVDRVIHIGDFISPPAIHCLEGLMVYAVYGNNDGERAGLKNMVGKIGGQLADEILEMAIPGGQLAAYHGTVPAILMALIRSQVYTVVVSGHTHRLEDRWEGPTRVLNPGTAHGFGKEATVMLYDTTTSQTEPLSL